MHKTISQFRQQDKAETYLRIEAILEEGPFVAETRAVHRAYFLYQLRWSQVGARISEMNDLGWVITSLILPESEWQSGVRTAYRLDSKPLRAIQPPQSNYMRKALGEDPAAISLFAEAGPQ